MKKDSIEMRPEYDFSGATRSRYATSLGAEERKELLRRSAALDAQYWFGYALQRIQALEAMIVAYLSLAHDRTPEIAGREAAALLEGEDDEALSRLAPGLSSWNDRFQKVMDERSWLVHKAGFALGSERSEPSMLAEAVERFATTAREAAELGEDLRMHLEENLAASGLGLEEVRHRTDEVIHNWLAA
jgi:hypothetical protein